MCPNTCTWDMKTLFSGLVIDSPGRKHSSKLVQVVTNNFVAIILDKLEDNLSATGATVITIDMLTVGKGFI